MNEQEEIRRLRARITELEGVLEQANPPRFFSQRQAREAFDADVELITEFGRVPAQGVNISEAGICFDIARPLEFEVRLAHDGATYHYQAMLVWMRPLVGGGHRLGFEFVPDASLVVEGC